MTPEMLGQLAAEFPAEAIRARRDITCKPCKGGGCLVHSRVPCEVCGETLTTAHVHSEYVALPWIRERLDEVDPDWNWRPLAHSPEGLPMQDAGSLWIELTIGGKTMIGVGDAGDLTGADRRKGAASNALRHAAAGFGVGRYLAKRQPEPADTPPTDPAPAEDTTEPDDAEQPTREASEVDATPSELRGRIRAIDRKRGRRTGAQTAHAFTQWSRNGTQFTRASKADLAAYLDHLLHTATE